MTKKTVKNASLGFLIGIPVGIVILIMLSILNEGGNLVFPESMLEKAGSPAMALAMHVFLSGALGAVAWAGMSFYEIESWGMLKSFVVHYLVIMAAFIVIGVNLGWIGFNAEDIGIMALIMGIGYFMVWLIMYLRYRSKTKELNMYLEKEKQPGAVQ